MAGPSYNAGSFIGRQTLPQNFVESVRSGMRLPQPQPQFFYGMAALSAMMRTLMIQEGAGTAANFVKMMGYGGDAPDTGLDRYIRTAEAYPGMVLAVTGFGQSAGDTIKMRRPVYTKGGLTQAARQVKPQIATSLQGQNITMEEVPVILKQFEGPWNAATSAVGPYQINDFDARYLRNADNLAAEVVNHLAFDYISWLDAVVIELFQASSHITYADNQTNIQSFTAGAGHSINLQTLLTARKNLSDRERAPFDNGRYMAVVPTLFNTDMVQDPAYRQLAATAPVTEKNLLFRYLGSVQDLDIFESTTLPTYAAGATVPGDSSGTVPANSKVFEAHVFGPHAVGFGQAEPPTMHTTSDTDYGKNAKVIWRSVEAFQTLDERGIERVLFQSAN